jgi:hypothetical protein
MRPTFSSAVRSALVAVVALPTLNPPVTRATIRRPVAIVVSIDAATYWDRLDQSTSCGAHCQQLQTELVEPLRAVLAKKFAFADWTRQSTPPPDTLLVRWVEQPPPLTPGALVEFRLIGAAARARPDSLRVDFEVFANMLDRPDWLVAHVRDQWMRRLSPILDGGDLVTHVLG